ncbi:MAG: cell division protein FtsZ [Alphaproteobacteria bacterium]|nr:cell division protein FtsZ [Alphaproteobacteria bacterium]
MINVRIQNEKQTELSPKIKVVGVGGAGGNAVNNMINSNLDGVDFVVCNTDSQALAGSAAEHVIQLGRTVTGGLGAGANPSVGKAAAEESLEDVMGYLDGANMVFVTAGMGGGTGTGAAPVIAKAARDQGILTVGVVTKPFHFEGTLRMKMAEEGIEEMQEYVDTLIVIPNQNLFRIANEKTTFAEAFKMADGVLQSGVRGVTDLMVRPGLINLDFADIRSVMHEMGKAMMGTGESQGERRAIEAAEAAINNPLLDDISMKGARGVIINVTGGMDMTLYEADEACNRIREEVDSNANIIFGSTFDESLDGMMRVSVVATGIDGVQTSRVIGGGKGLSNAGRAQPVTPSTEAKKENETMAVSTQQQEVAETSEPAQQQPAAPVNSRQAYNPAAVMAPRQTDIFDQTAPRYTSQASTPSTNEPQNAMPQATRMGDTFIPPAPMQVSQQEREQGGAYSYVQQTMQTSAAPAVAEAQPQQQQQNYGPKLDNVQEGQVQEDVMSAASTGSSLTLRPPVPAAHKQASHMKKRSPSLFERITGVLRDEEADVVGIKDDVSSAPVAKQGQLNIDAPSAPATKNAEDELDIPAFLRRQAN